jgi:hypothetical protein
MQAALGKLKTAVLQNAKYKRTTTEHTALSHNINFKQWSMVKQ